MKDRPPTWRVAADILKKQSWTADKGWTSCLRVEQGANNSSQECKTYEVRVPCLPLGHRSVWPEVHLKYGII